MRSPSLCSQELECEGVQASRSALLRCARLRALMRGGVARALLPHCVGKRSGPGLGSFLGPAWGRSDGTCIYAV